MLLFSFGDSGRASAETLPTKGNLDSRVRTTPYNPDQVYKLYGFVGYAVELIFEEGETFAGAGGGDHVRGRLGDEPRLL